MIYQGLALGKSAHLTTSHSNYLSTETRSRPGLLVLLSSSWQQLEHVSDTFSSLIGQSRVLQHEQLTAQAILIQERLKGCQVTLASAVRFIS